MELSIGKIYTTYISKAKNIPIGANKLIIMRQPPFDLKKYPQYKWAQALSPKDELLWAYKNNEISWETFKEKFLFQITKGDERESVLIAEHWILGQLLAGNDVYLICCEKDNAFCHRSIYAEYFNSRYEFGWEEMK